MVNQVREETGRVDPPAPHDYTTQALIACLCCCFITGLIALCAASAASDALARGDLFGAQLAAKRARLMVRISYVGPVFTAAIIIMLLLEARALKLLLHIE